MISSQTFDQMKIPIPYSISKEELDRLAEAARESIHALSRTVLDGLRPPAGPYAFFHHNGHALARVEDCKRIVGRLFDEVHALVQVTLEQERLLPKDWPPEKPYPEDVQEAARLEHYNNALAQLDLESLYIFGAILLDQWALQASAVGNLQVLRDSPFVEVIDRLERDGTTVLAPLWNELSSEMLWLSYQIRWYRNKFIVHANRPWQRGTTRSSFGEEYKLHTPSPPSWLDDKLLDDEILKLLHLAPQRIRDAKPDYWERARPGRLIEILFDQIGSIQSRTDREQISRLYAMKGGSTPTFQVLAKNIFAFVTSGTVLLERIARANLAQIDLGKPAKTSAEMWKESE